MLRITVHDNPRILTFQLEGRLAGPWLRELEECWKSTLACWQKPTLRVDLTGVTFIDASGVRALRSLPTDRVAIVPAPDFIDALLKGDGTS